MKILILGGGKLVGRALTEASTSRGHAVTTFTRSTLPPGAEMGAIETIFADRTDEHAFDFTKNRHRALSIATSQYKAKGTIIHSDMGSVFKSERYRKSVRQAGLVQSMGNAGLSFANQMIESFFGKIKTELLNTHP